MSTKQILESRKCPKCGDEEGLFVCSFGAVNCANCREFIRRLHKREMKIFIERLKEIRNRVE